MFDLGVLRSCAADHVAALVEQWNPLDLISRFEDPEQTAVHFEPPFLQALTDGGIDPSAVRAHVRSHPYLHLQGVFDVVNLPETPTSWVPVPTHPGTLAARVLILLFNRLCGMETVSYGSENNGALFVNLVTLPGEGREAEKSRGQMKGHTDAAAFPVRGMRNPDHPRIAPSPDLVMLAALRNNAQVPTTVVPLQCALDALSDEQRGVLKGPNLVIHSQRSFERGIRRTMGQDLVLDGAPVLFDSEEGPWIRYTHSNSQVYDEDDSVAVDAKKTFESACAHCAQRVVLAAGDLLIVNNRKALHGRAVVGNEVGGETRWLIRSYGLDTTDLSSDRRHASSRYQLFP